MSQSPYNSSQPIVGIVMGSDSDWSVMEAAAEVLDEFGIPCLLYTSDAADE